LFQVLQDRKGIGQRFSATGFGDPGDGFPPEKWRKGPGLDFGRRSKAFLIEGREKGREKGKLMK
jgi:hypothetical protein